MKLRQRIIALMLAIMLMIPLVGNVGVLTICAEEQFEEIMVIEEGSTEITSEDPKSEETTSEVLSDAEDTAETTGVSEATEEVIEDI